MSRAQATRLIGSYLRRGEVTAEGYKRHCFASHYTRAEVEPLAEADGRTTR
jgi:hypothetical protein